MRKTSFVSLVLVLLVINLYGQTYPNIETLLSREKNAKKDFGKIKKNPSSTKYYVLETTLKSYGEIRKTIKSKKYSFVGEYPMNKADFSEFECLAKLERSIISGNLPRAGFWPYSKIVFVRGKKSKSLKKVSEQKVHYLYLYDQDEAYGPTGTFGRKIICYDRDSNYNVVCIERSVSGMYEKKSADCIPGLVVDTTFFVTSSDSVTIQFGDYGTVDGDIIDLFLDGKFEKRFFLQRKMEEKTLAIEKTTIVTFRAISEGTNRPCTIALVKPDGSKEKMKAQKGNLMKFIIEKQAAPE